MTGVIYFLVVCFAAGPQTYCEAAGHRFYGPDARQVCHETADRANRSVDQSIRYYCAKREEWRS